MRQLEVERDQMKRENAALNADLDKVRRNEKDRNKKIEDLMGNVKRAEKEKERLLIENIEVDKLKAAIEEDVKRAEERAEEAERIRQEMERGVQASDAERERLRSEAERLRVEAQKSRANAEHDMVIYMEKNIQLENELTIQMERLEQENYNLRIAEALAKVRKAASGRQRA